MMRRRAKVSAPAIFGRLPAQRDYVRWRVTAAEGQIWHAWLNQQTWLGQGKPRVVPATGSADKGQENDGWIRLSPSETPEPERHPLPWSFVLSPGFLPVSGRDEWLIGALIASHDITGRPWPLVIYQRCGRAWLEQTLPQTQGWLYWLAKLAATELAGPTQRSGRIMTRADQLWAHWQPASHWNPLRRILRRAAPRHKLQTEIIDAPKIELPGVRHLPWPGWPQQMLAQAPPGQGWFWQQNSEGRYVDALRLQIEKT